MSIARPAPADLRRVTVGAKDPVEIDKSDIVAGH